MKLGFLFLFVSLWGAMLDSRSVYEALAGQSLEEVESVLTQLEKEDDVSIVRAYRGALLAKKAFFLEKVPDKITSFKEGVLLLESEIEDQPNNIEYRFLRLAIQERSPKILGYKNNLEEDKTMIIKNMSTVNAALKEQVLNYAKTSTILLSADLPK